MFTTTPESTHPYPRTYKVVGFWLIFCAFVSFAATGLGVAGLLNDVVWDTSSTTGQQIIFSLICFLLIGGGPVYLVALLRTRLILYNDAIELRGLFRSRRLLRSEIAGQRRVIAAYPTIVIYPKSRAARNMMVELAFNRDEAFDVWMSTIPFIDAKTLKARR